MKRTTISAEEELIKEIKDIANEENRSVAEVIREALEIYINQKRKKKRLSFISIGNSEKKDIAKNHEELLWKRLLVEATFDSRHRQHHRQNLY